MQEQLLFTLENSVHQIILYYAQSFNEIVLFI